MKSKFVSPSLATCVAVLGTALQSHAASLAFDPITNGSNPANGEYAAASVAGQNPAVTGFTGTWNNAGVSATATGLTYSNPNYFPASGGALQHTAQGRPNRIMDTTLSNAFAGTSTIYMSFLAQFGTGADNAPWGGYAAMEVGSNGDADANKALAIGIDNAFAGSFMYQFNNGAKLALGSFRDSATHLFLVRFDMNTAAASDSVTMWIDPDLSGGLASDPTGGTTVGGQDLFSINNIRFGAGGTNNFVDEIRFGTTLNSALAVPEPGASMLGAIGSLALLRRRRR